MYGWKRTVEVQGEKEVLVQKRKKTKCAKEEVMEMMDDKDSDAFRRRR